MKTSSNLVLFLAVLALPSQAFALDDTVDDRRSRILKIAESYVSHTWIATSKQVLHGPDPDGVQVDTPDDGKFEGGFTSNGKKNVGIPYKWGGFSSLKEFDQGIAKGILAGHIPSSRDDGASQHAVGVDCSGLVSICWELPKKQSTRSLGDLCYELDSYDVLSPGDVLNTFNGHVMIFESWVDHEKTKLQAIEAITPKVSRTQHSVDSLKKLGFVPLRYRPLDPRWKNDSVDFSALTFLVKSLGEFESTEEPLQDVDWLMDLPHPIANSQGGEWVKYDARTTDSLSQEKEPGIVGEAIGLVREEDSFYHTHSMIEDNGLSLHQLDTQDRDASFLDSWLSSMTPWPLTNRTVSACSIREGTISINGESYSATRFEATTRALYKRSQDADFPLTVVFEVTLCEAVPVQGFVSSRIRIETDSGQVVEGLRTLHSFRGV